MINVGIIGGAGYTAGELIRTLLYHPMANLKYIHSNSQSGKLISDIHTDLLDETWLTFSGNYDFEGLDVLFLCMGHGKSIDFFSKVAVPSTLKIIDLSRDFRLKSNTHQYIYGLPELNKLQIANANFIANPGCFATAIQLGVLPLAQADLIHADLHIHGITGSTGAGQQPIATTHFSWRNNNVSIYKAFEHQHLDEIKQSILQLQSTFTHDIHFLPVRGNFARGIFVSTYLESDLSIEEAQSIYQSYYKEHPFVNIAKNNPSLKQIVNTNKCIIYLEKHNNKLLIISMIDNLLKGASGQAVQNMNLIFGLPEKTGLHLKAVVF